MDSSIVCPICRVIDKKGKKLHSHYGGLCCPSCKIFFLRIVRDNQSNKLECKYGGNCNLLEDRKRKCRKCRYEMCLRNGLVPENVLDEEERQKWIHPRKKRRTESNTNESDMSFDEQNEAFDGNDDQPETSQEAMKQEGEVVQRKVSSVSSASSDCDIYMPLEETEVRFFNFQSF